MKTTIGVLMLATTLAGSAWYYKGPDAPSPISVQSVTEKSIKEELKHEQRHRQIQQSIKAARAIYKRVGCRSTYAETTGNIAFKYGVSARLLAAVVFVESSCNPNAISDRYSVGLTQVNPKYHHYSRAELKDPQRNLEIGASILADYIRRYGLVKGLHAYNGFGNSTDEYSQKVLAAAGIEVKG